MRRSANESISPVQRADHLFRFMSSLMSNNRLTVFILSHERPLYLWATLDGLYRATKSDVRFVLVDQNSQNPLVHQVIHAFEARGMIEHVVRNPSNDLSALPQLMAEWHQKVGEIFFYIENDVVIREQDSCWALRMQQQMQLDPQLAMLGSKIDSSDFVSRERLERYLGREPTLEEADQIKLRSPERNMPDIGPNEVASPFNPPGRLLALRTAAVLRHGFHRDSTMHRILVDNGWRTGIFGGVIHRHLSLYNFFDWPDYSMEARRAFMRQGNEHDASFAG